MTPRHDRVRSSADAGRRDAPIRVFPRRPQRCANNMTTRAAAGCGSGHVRRRCSGLAEFPHFYPGAGGTAEGYGPGRGEREADGRPRAAVSVRLPCRFTRVRVTGRSRWEDGPAPEDVELAALGYNQKHITPRFLYNFRVLLLRDDNRSAAGRSQDQVRPPYRPYSEQDAALSNQRCAKLLDLRPPGLSPTSALSQLSSGKVNRSSGSHVASRITPKL